VGLPVWGWGAWLGGDEGAVDEDERDVGVKVVGGCDTKLMSGCAYAGVMQALERCDASKYHYR
jgi:hypothetical protein